MPRNKILVVDDDLSLQEVLKIRLEKQNYEVSLAGNAKEAIASLKKDKPALVLLDVMLPDIDGIELLKQMKGLRQDLVVIMMTAIGSMPMVVKAMKEGAYDYISKPFDSEQLCLLIQKAFEVQALKEELRQLKNKLTQKPEPEAVIVGTTPKMQEIYKGIARLAERKVTVLIRGESGTGKELVAKAIHSHSSRKGPFVAVDCAALAPTLLESELFGHEKGAFTGATYERVGRFEEANGGTLFLDEIGNLSIETQAKLLRALQEEEIRRIGAKAAVKIDLRIIAATNVDLEKMVAEGKFREDLYHRLNVVSLNIPALGERKEDIPLLANYFLKKIAAKFNEPVKELSKEAMSVLFASAWPGNVRELMNIIESAVVACKGSVILPDDLPKNITQDKAMGVPVSSEGCSLESAVEELEKGLILKALEESRWVKSEAAKLLSIDRKALSYKIDKLGLKKPTPISKA